MACLDTGFVAYLFAVLARGYILEVKLQYLLLLVVANLAYLPTVDTFPAIA